MSWFRSGLQGISISDWLTAGPAAADDPAAAVDAARHAMLDALGEAGANKRATLSLKLRAARDLQSLWDLRPELMTAACQLYGESEGRRRLAAATTHFEGLLPRAGALTSPPRRHAMQRRT